MKKLFVSFFIAAMVVLTLAQPMQVRADSVTHLSPDDVWLAIKSKMGTYGVNSITEDDLRDLAAPHPECKPQTASVSLYSFGDKNRTAKLELLDGNDTPLSDVKWYAYTAYPEGLWAAGESIGDNPAASLLADGTVTSLREAGQGESIVVWAEYDQAIYRFNVEIVTVANSRKQVALDKIDEVISANNWDTLSTNVQKAEQVYYYLINNIKYDWTFVARYGDFVAGAMLDGKAVCNGYAKTFFNFMDKLGVPCRFNYGDVDTTTGPEKSHAWNVVQMDDGAWYYLDATYGDKENGADQSQLATDYTFFLQTAEEFNTSHKTAVATETTGTKYSAGYYKTNGLLATNESELQTVISKLLDSNAGDTAVLNFAVKPGLEGSVENALRAKWDITSLQTGKTNCVRLGGTGWIPNTGADEKYLLQEYLISRNNAPLPDPGSSSGGSGGGTTPDPGQGSGGSTPDPGQGSGGSTPDPGQGAGGGTGGSGGDSSGGQTPAQPVVPVQPDVPLTPAAPVSSETAAAETVADYVPATQQTYQPNRPNEETMEKLASVKTGDKLKLRYCESNKTVKREVFQSIAGKDIGLTFNMGNLWWMVDGKQISKDVRLRDLNLKADLDRAGTSALVPEDVTAPRRAGALQVMKLRLQDNGDFGYEMKLHIKIAKEYAGKNVKLLSYHPETGTLTEVSTGIINQDGIVLLPLTRSKGCYLIIIEK